MGGNGAGMPIKRRCKRIMLQHDRIDQAQQVGCVRISDIPIKRADQAAAVVKDITGIL